MFLYLNVMRAYSKKLGIKGGLMRYHYEKPGLYVSLYGETYICDHPVYDSCTLFKMGNRALAVIQQRVDAQKRKYWSEIDPWLTDALYLHPKSIVITSPDCIPTASAGELGTVPSTLIASLSLS